MIQVFEASTLYQVASLSAMIQAGTFGDARRILVLVNSARQPELTGRIQDAEAFPQLAEVFERVVDFGADLWPRRPHQFDPRAAELSLWQTLLRERWGLGQEPVELVLESLQVNPARGLARVFASSPLSVHADGLMSYGPTRTTLPPNILQRVVSVAYLDLVPGLRPLLLTEASPTLLPVPVEALAKVVSRWAEAATPSDAVRSLLAAGTGPIALVLGQYLADLGIVTAEEEAALAAQMLDAAAQAGASVVAYKAHPSASVTSQHTMASAAKAAGLELVLIPDTVAAEVVAHWLQPLAVVSIFSTALATISRTSGTRAIAVGTKPLLPALKPFENSNRVPLVLVDALLRPGADPSLAADPERLQGLVDALAYAMRSKLLPQLREEAVRFLTAEPALRDRYFKQRRLRVLELPRGAGAGRPGLARRTLNSVVKNPEYADAAARSLAFLRTSQGRRNAPRLAARSVGSRLVAWSKKG